MRIPTRLLKLVQGLQGKAIRLLPWPLAFLGSLLLFIGTERRVDALVDGQRLSFTTHARTVGGALRSAGLAPAERDLIFPPPSTALEDRMVLTFQRARGVLLDLGGDQVWVQTAQMHPANILRAEGIRLYPGDRLWVDGIPFEPLDGPPANRPQRIRLERARTIHVRGPATDEWTIHSSGPQIGHALVDSGILIREGDRLTPSPEAPLRSDASVSFVRAQPVTILVDGTSITTHALGSTAGEALVQAGVALQGLDYTIPAVEQPIGEDRTLRVIRVQEPVLIEAEPLPFETVREPVADLEIDQSTVVDPGEYGIQASRVRVRLEDGVEVGRLVENTWVAIEPRPKVLGYGTQIVVRTLQSPDGPLEYWRALTFYATSYSPARSGTSPDKPWYGHVYCGGLLQNGFVGVDLDYVPCGTRLYVPGYGFAVAMDTGRITGAWIDLGYEDDDYVPWHQFVTVYFLTPVPALDQIAWIIPPGTFY